MQMCVGCRFVFGQQLVEAGKKSTENSSDIFLSQKHCYYHHLCKQLKANDVSDVTFLFLKVI